MTTYITITDAETNPDAPLTSTLAKKWRDNPIAISEGAAGAPRILLPALEEIAAGTTIRSRIDAEVWAEGGITGHGFAFIQTGSVRVTFEHKADFVYREAQVVRIRNGSETVLATHANTTSYVSRTADVPIIPGDFVFVQNGIGSGGGSSVTYFLRNVRFQTSGANLWPAPDGVPLENTYA